MAKTDQHRVARVYHAIVAVLILLAGGGLLGIGIWLTTSDADPFDLDYSGDTIFQSALKVNIIAMAIGAFLLISAIASIISLSRQCIGRAFRIIYLILAVIILLVLFSVCVVSAISVRLGDTASGRSFVTAAWVNSIINKPAHVCAIERHFQCKGLFDAQCSKCDTGFELECRPNRIYCTPCADVDHRTPEGCFQKIKTRIRAVFFPMAIVSGILGGFVLSDIVVTSCI